MGNKPVLSQSRHEGTRRVNAPLSLTEKNDEDVPRQSTRNPSLVTNGNSAYLCCNPELKTIRFLSRTIS